MNELEAMNKRRVTLSGSPVGSVGTAMIKHSYFINFLHKLLGVELDDCIKYSINQTINYSELGVSIVNINTNSYNNPYRTNKVRISTPDVTKVIRKIDQKQIVYMMHHTPLYTIDYIDDIFYMKIELSEKEKEQVYRGVPENKRSEWSYNQVLIEFIKHLIEDPIKAFYGIPRNDYEAAFLLFLNTIKKNNPLEYNENNLDDFEYYLNTAQEDREYDDRCKKIKYNLIEQKDASEQDGQAYASFTERLFGKSYGKYIVIGGHAHRAAKYSGAHVGKLSNCQCIIEASRFVRQKDLNYDIIKISSKVQYEQDVDYYFVGENPQSIGNSTTIEKLKLE